MLGRAVAGCRTLAGLALALGAACSSAEDPFTSGPGHASVAGLVTDAAGAPISGTTVHITCAGDGSPTDVPTDSTGHYLANLGTGSDPFDGSGGELLCHFTEPDAVTPRARADTSLGFARGPVLVPVQTVHLREP
jgi:hypothetical protein